MRAKFFAPLVLAFCALLAAPALAAPPLPPLTIDEAFGGSSFDDPRLSPDGRHLALLVDRQGRMGLSIFNLDKGQFESHLGFVDADIAEPR